MFDEASVESIVGHMNEDHADAIGLYVQHYAGIEGASDAQMLSIDAQGMDLSFYQGGEQLETRIPFEPPLTDASEVRSRLVEMVKEARQQLQN